MNEKCKYPEKYYWDDFHIQHTYRCDEIPLESGYCIFHDPDYLNPKHNDIDARFENLKEEFGKKLNRFAENKEKDWLFIGHIIPGFTLTDRVIEANVFFMYARILGKL